MATQAVREAFVAVEEHGFVLSDFWSHSVSAGCAAYILSFPGETPRDEDDDTGFESTNLDADTVRLLSEIDLPGRIKLDLATENTFLSGIMHDIGKVTMVHSYPGLFPLLTEEMRKNDFQLSVLAAEQDIAGGLTHPVVGEILMRKWGMDEGLLEAVLHHHDPTADMPSAFLVSIADMVAGCLNPFPTGGKARLTKALDSGEASAVREALPAGFHDQAYLSVDELIALVRHIRPHVKSLTDTMREAVAPS